MSSEIKANSIQDKTGTKTLATLSSSAVTLHSDVSFPAGMVLTASGLTFSDTDSGSITLNTTNGFGTIIGAISVPTGTKIQMFISGGMIFYDSSASWIPCVNYKTASTFSGATDGTFPGAGEYGTWYSDSTSVNKFSIGPLMAEASNSTGSAVDYYFRAGMKSFVSKSSVRWYANSGNVSRALWYQIIKT